jgi:hypothetical protein
VSGKLSSDGIRAGEIRTNARRIVTVIGSGFRLRITGTVILAPTLKEASQQRKRVKTAVATFAKALRAEGYEVDFVVGAPRSPGDLAASLQALVDPSREERVA